MGRLFGKEYDAGTYYDQARELIIAGNYESALPLLEKAIELHPEYTNAYIHKGLCLRNLNRNDEATQAYLAAIKLDPNNSTAYGNLAVNFMAVKKYQAAYDYFTKAFNLGDTDLEFFISAAICGYKINRIKNAVELLDDAVTKISARDAHGSLYYTKAVIFQKSGNDVEAKNSLLLMNQSPPFSEESKKLIKDAFD